MSDFDKLGLRTIVMHGIAIIAFITSSVWGMVDNTGSIYGPLACLIIAIVSYIFYLIYAIRYAIWDMLGPKDTPDNSDISKTYGFVHEPVDNAVDQVSNKNEQPKNTAKEESQK